MIVVTGGAGFIGSVLVHELNKLGREDIIIVDRLREANKWLNIRDLKFEQFIHADEFFDHESLHNMEIESIFHMGASSATTERNVDYLMKNNVEYSQKIWKLALKKGAKLLYASSAATYGAGEFGYKDDHSEVDKLRPLNPYGYSKQLFDQWALKQSEKPKVCFGLKFFNVYGPRECHKEEQRSLVNKAFGQINERGLVKLFKSHKEGYKDGEQLRDFVYVKDIALGMIELERKSEGFELLNMGTGKARSFYDLVDSTFKAMNLETKVEFIDMPESLRSQYQYFTEANMDKFQKLCPDFQFSSIEKGVEDYVRNHLMLK